MSVLGIHFVLYPLLTEGVCDGDSLRLRTGVYSQHSLKHYLSWRQPSGLSGRLVRSQEDSCNSQERRSKEDQKNSVCTFMKPLFGLCHCSFASLGTKERNSLVTQDLSWKSLSCYPRTTKQIWMLFQLVLPKVILYARHISNYLK
jgi:hypothetical protein